MRYLIKSGKIIELLSSPIPSKEHLHCPKCQVNFNTTTNRRACFNLCGHIHCLQCILAVNECEQCGTAEAQCSQFTRDHAGDNEAVVLDEEENVSELPVPLSSTLPPAQQVWVVSSVLGQSAGSDGNEFPTINQLFVSALPILEAQNPFQTGIQIQKQEPGELKDIADKGYTSRKEMFPRRRKEHCNINPYSCDTCDRRFSTKTNLKYHKIIHTNERPFKCSCCDLAFNTRYLLSNHLIKHHGIKPKRRSQAKKMKISTKKVDVAEFHSIARPECIPTPRATLRFVRSDASDFEIMANDTPTLSAADCPKRKGKRQKRGKKHDIQTPAKGALLKRIYVRRHIPKHSSRQQSGKHHITHKICRPYKYTQCDTIFKGKYRLNRHVRLMHSRKSRKLEVAKNGQSHNKPVMRSPYYNSNFETTFSIEHQMQWKHPNLLQYICSVCGFPFELQKQLNVHIKTHKNKLECAICTMVHKGEFSLNRHLKTVHGVRLRIHKFETPQEGVEYCPECQSQFGKDGCTKVAYTTCGHISCIDCVKSAELGCGQCTTENALKCRSLEPQSPSKSPGAPRFLQGKIDKMSFESEVAMDVQEEDVVEVFGAAG